MGGGGGVSPKKEKNVSLRPHKQYSVQLSSKITVETKRKTPVSLKIRSHEIPIEVTHLNMLQDKKSSVHNFKIQYRVASKL